MNAPEHVYFSFSPLFTLEQHLYSAAGLANSWKKRPEVGKKAAWQKQQQWVPQTRGSTLIFSLDCSKPSIPGRGQCLSSVFTDDISFS